MAVLHAKCSRKNFIQSRNRRVPRLLRPTMDCRGVGTPIVSDGVIFGYLGPLGALKLYDF